MNGAAETDVLVVGTGPGGAGVALDLARSGKKVCLIEGGRAVAPLGKPIRSAARYLGGILGALSLRRGLLFTEEWLPVMRGVTTGGSSMLYLGTAYDPDPEMWTPFGFDLKEEAEERKKELAVGPLPDRFIAPGVHDISRAAQDLGYCWDKINKFIKPDKCVEGCNICLYGCPHGAKWHARDWVLEALSHGATLVNDCFCEEVIHEGGRAGGVRGVRRDGRPFELKAERVVVAGGGLGSPSILQRSGIHEAGRKFFFDPFVMTTGVFDRPVGAGSIMSTGMHLKEEGVMMTDLQYPRMVLAAQGLAVGKLSPLWKYKKTLPIMSKIRDAMSGSVDIDGRMHKRLTDDDLYRLNTGRAVARKILKAAGAEEIWHTRVGAAHPGGTCAMGRIVDENLETRIKGLYVCDASVIPCPFGIPPTLTVLSLARRLSRRLLSELGE